MAGPDELITYYDDVTGERAGLSAAEVGGWAAATAGLLTGECGLAPGSRAAVLLPPHWQTAVVLLGAWSAGIKVSFRGWATAGLTPAGEPLDVTFVHRRRIGNWLDEVPTGKYQFVLGLEPAAAPTADVPEGYRDYPTAVRPHLGSAPPATGVAARDAATVDGTTYGEYAEVAAEVARARGIGRGDRVLIDTAAQEEPLLWLLAPMSAGASIVLCTGLDRARLDERIAAEQVSHVFA